MRRGSIDEYVIEARASSKLSLISRGQLSREEGGCQIWSPRVGSVSVLAQIKREYGENWASTKAGTPTGSHSEWEIAPLTLQHFPTILLSIC